LKINEKLAIIRLIRTQNIGPVTLTMLLRRHKTGLAVLDHLPEISKRSRIPITITTQSEAEDEMAAAEKIGAQIIVRGEDTYPKSLAMFDDAPGCLTCLGHHHLLQKPSLSVVGSRNASLNALNLTRLLSVEVGQKGYIIVSGMARGIDAAAHEGSLSSGSIAVLAGGVDQVYPRENTSIYESLKDQGVIISEMPTGIQPFARHFPIRNRIIASLGLGLLVVEAGLKSGSLITAREAADRGRDVMAIPGSPLDPRSKGCNNLLRDGATLVQDSKDIIEHIDGKEWNTIPPRMPLFDDDPPADPNQDEVDKAKQELLNLLSFDASPVDELIKRCHFSISVISMALFEMELAGDIVRQYGNRVSLLWKPESPED
jgi:DNA processing protein